MKSVLDRSFHYTPSVQTDIRKTFARIRREQREQQRQREAAEAQARDKVSPIHPAGRQSSLAVTKGIT